MVGGKWRKVKVDGTVLVLVLGLLCWNALIFRRCGWVVGWLVLSGKSRRPT